MKKYLVIVLLCIYYNAFSQNCNCEDNFLWVKKTFEENDAGFQFVLDTKGKTEYEKHNRAFLEKAQKTIRLSDCGDLLYDWLLFFRKGHIALNVLDDAADSPSNSSVDPSGWESVVLTDREINKLDEVPQNGLEGIWKSEPYTLGIIKEANEYIGFVIDAPGTPWQPKQIKLRLHADPDGNTYSGHYFLRNYSKYELKNVKILGKNYIQLGQFSLQRANPKTEDSKNIAQYKQLIKTTQPMMLEYSKNTLVLRIPSFHESNKKAIDSLLKVFHKKIMNTPNLVVDIRNNGGGSDRSYTEIIPYLYTNPIRVVSLEMLSTPLNNQRMESFLTLPDLSKKDKQEIEQSLKVLNENLGKFVNLGGEKVLVQTLDKVYTNPKNVAILTNESNGSTSEQFLLAAKQSTKTKLFGRTTFGVLDISNMHFVKAPCGKIELGYCLSKSLRIPHMAIDDKGIMPDYYLDDTIPDYEWIDFVEQTFKNTKR